MKKLLLGSFLAALALFFWGFIYYGISGIPYNFLDEPAETAPTSLNEAFPKDGVYLIPNPHAEDRGGLMAEGPIALINIKRDGFTNHGGMMVSGFLHGWGYCLLLAFLLKQICKKTSYAGRVGFVTLVAVSGAFLARFGDAIWWFYDWGWQLSSFAYHVIGGLIVGFVLAKFIPERRETDGSEG